MEKILPITHRTCLFCGEEKKQHWIDSEMYYECNCYDSSLHLALTQEIEELQRQLPKEKFTITSEPILRNKKNIL